MAEERQEEIFLHKEDEWFYELLKLTQKDFLISYSHGDIKKKHKFLTFQVKDYNANEIQNLSGALKWKWEWWLEKIGMMEFVGILIHYDYLHHHLQSSLTLLLKRKKISCSNGDC